MPINSLVKNIAYVNGRLLCLDVTYIDGKLFVEELEQCLIPHNYYVILNGCFR